LAPDLFAIVRDYAMRETLLDQSLGLKVANQVGTNSKPKYPARYITDLNFAEDSNYIMH
jgi:hypothetical protein